MYPSDSYLCISSLILNNCCLLYQPRTERSLKFGSDQMISLPPFSDFSFLFHKKPPRYQFCWLLCLCLGVHLCVSFFPQKQAFDDILTNKAPELLKHLDTFLGDNNWLVGKSVSIFFVSPIPIRLPEKWNHWLLPNFWISCQPMKQPSPLF